MTGQIVSAPLHAHGEGSGRRPADVRREAVSSLPQRATQAVRVDTDTAQGPELVLQGKFADAATRAACSQDSPPADDEGVIRIPVRMVAQIREACDAAEAAHARL
ncbi:hypothetical protein ACFQMH_19290 [Streptomyces viridiviolaceus]|uniref:Uncharacterized protein n=1 Tax=Streptomyces viridiviolaceus TaxID=68282 RepID=A0ABW2E101_9ACTN|nr:hypothetical protein [Streptomyces viridiviolaceus]